MKCQAATVPFQMVQPNSVYTERGAREVGGWLGEANAAIYWRT